MHLRFHSIRIVRFRSFLSEAVLHFDDAGPGLYFLKGRNKTSIALGSNGSGKSSIVDALLWCLYGKTVQGLKNPDIIPWSGKGKTEVEVTVFVDKQKHVIKRTVGPNLLTIDGKEAGQKYVDDLIAIPFEIIPYTIILGQRQPLFFDLKASEALKLFSEVLNLDRWEQRSAHAAESVKSLEKEISVKEVEITALENAQRQAESDLKSLKLQSSQWEAERADKLSSAEEQKNVLQKRIDEVSNERDSADLQLDRALTELKAIKPVLDNLRDEEYAYSKSMDKFHNIIVTSNSDLKKEYKTLESLEHQESCPMCGQQLLNKKQVKSFITNAKTKIADLEMTVGVATKTIDDLLAKQSAVSKTYDIQLAAKEKFENDAEEARSTLDRLLPKIAQWEAGLKVLSEELEERSNITNPYTEQIQTLRCRRDQGKVQIEQAKKTITSKTEYCERVRFWIKGFKDIKLLTIEEILQELEITTGSMCEEFGLVGWQIKYDIERETKSGTIARGLNITVLSPNNKNAVKWESWSGGEAQRLRIIGTAALSSVLLNHVGITTNLEVYDEPTVGLSKEGVSDLVELLSQRAKDTKKNIWLIDHHTIESSRFIQTTLVIKDKNGSQLEIV